MAATGRAESRLPVCLQWCERVTELGPVRGQSAASEGAAFARGRQAPV